MTQRKQLFGRTTWMILLAIASVRLLKPSLLHAQQSSCTAGAIDYQADDGSDGIDVEQTVCLYSEGSGVDATVETDDDAYEDWDNIFIEDVFGVGSEAQVYGTNGAYFSGAPIADSGMNTSSTSPYGSSAYAEVYASNNSAIYGLQGLSNLCYNWDGGYSFEQYGCSWGYGGGLWTQLQVSATTPSVATTISASLTPSASTYGSNVLADIAVTTANAMPPTNGTVSCGGGGITVGPAVLSATGTATVILNGMAPGDEYVTCSFSGGGAYTDSNVTVLATVNTFVPSAVCTQAAQAVWNSCANLAVVRWEDCYQDGLAGDNCGDPQGYVNYFCPNSAATMANSCSTMDAFGTFNLISILFDAPGNKSSVGFTNSVTDGQNTSASQSFSTSDQEGLNFSIGGFSFGSTYTITTTNTSTSTTQSLIQNQQSATFSSTTDAIDHTKDALSVWLNPQISVASLSVGDPTSGDLPVPFYLEGNWQYDPVSASPYADAPSSSMSIVTVTVGQLQNPTTLLPGQLDSQTLNGAVVPGLLSMCVNRIPENQCTLAQAQANGCGCQASDFAPVIQLYPFFNPTILTQTGGQTPTVSQVNAADPNNARFVQVLDSTGYPLVETLDGAIPNTQTSTLTDTYNTSQTYSQTISNSVGVTLGFQNPAPGAKSSNSFNWKDSSSLTWSNTESVGTSRSAVHTQTLTLGTSTATCYENISVFEDTLYHTYVFQGDSNAPNPCP